MDSENRKAILNLLESGKSTRLLDLGCGDGSFTLEMAKKVGTTELYGIDVFEESIQQCEANGIKAYQADLNEPMPVGSESFDAVCANQLLEHLNHTDLFIKEIYRLLMHGGYAVISVPNLAAWHNVFCLFWGWQPFSANISDEINVGNPLWPSYRMKAAGGKYPVHRRIPTYRGLKELLEYHGFKVEKILGVGFYPFPMPVARILSRIDPRHAVYLTIKVRKPKE